MRRLLVLAAFLLGACTLFVDTDDLTGGPKADAKVDGGISLPVAEAGSDATVAASSSCRALHEATPDAGSGAYSLTYDGGSRSVYCDMEAFGGGWTLVTPDMVVVDKVGQDDAPATSTVRVNRTRGVDAKGGVIFSVEVAQGNCGAGSGDPTHAFTVGELDGWREIMASFVFARFADCWAIFGNGDAPNTNVYPFDITRDHIGPEENMARTGAGKPAPFAGVINACTQNADNFWTSSHGADPKSARVTLRRLSQDQPAGLSVLADCGNGAWSITDIFVR